MLHIHRTFPLARQFAREAHHHGARAPAHHHHARALPAYGERPHAPACKLAFAQPARLGYRGRQLRFGIRWRDHREHHVYYLGREEALASRPVGPTPTRRTSRAEGPRDHRWHGLRCRHLTLLPPHSPCQSARQATTALFVPLLGISFAARQPHRDTQLTKPQVPIEGALPHTAKPRNKFPKVERTSQRHAARPRDRGSSCLQYRYSTSNTASAFEAAREGDQSWQTSTPPSTS